MKNNICELCQLQSNKLTRHHLFPKSKNNKLPKELKNLTINLCSLCHTTIHALFSESELKNSLYTLELLKNHPKLKKYIQWRQKHPNFSSNSTKLSNF